MSKQRKRPGVRAILRGVDADGMTFERRFVLPHGHDNLRTLLEDARTCGYEGLALSRPARGRRPEARP